jgi:hypothetical protein
MTFFRFDAMEASTRRVAPHDIAHLVADLVNPDSVNQQEVYQSIDGVRNTANLSADYEKTPQREIYLSTLRETFERHEEAKAISRLQQRCRMVIDKEYTIDVNNPNFCFSSQNSYLDFFLIIGKARGVDMFIPQAPPHTFTVTLNLRLPIKEFRAKYGTLGFNPTGAMLFVGQTSAEDLWIGMAPFAFFEEEGEPFDLSDKHGDTRLSTRHYRIMVAFIAFALSRLPERNYTVSSQYGINLDAPSPKWSDHFNIMYVQRLDLLLAVLRYTQRDDNEIKLTAQDLVMFNTTFIGRWRAFVQDAPDSWKADGWLTSHMPVGIVSAYGQNLPMAMSRTDEAHWTASRDYGKARFLTMAIATHIE